MLKPKEIDEIKRFADRRDLEIAVLIMARGWKWNGDHWAHSYFEPVETAQEAYEDQWHEDVRSLLTHIEEERGKIAELRQEFADDFSDGIKCMRVREEGPYVIRNSTQWRKALNEEYDILGGIDRNFPVPPSIEGSAE